MATPKPPPTPTRAQQRAADLAELAPQVLCALLSGHHLRVISGMPAGIQSSASREQDEAMKEAARLAVMASKALLDELEA